MLRLTFPMFTNSNRKGSLASFNKTQKSLKINGINSSIKIFIVHTALCKPDACEYSKANTKY